MLGVVACGADTCPPPEPAYCVEAELTLSEGIYGRAVAVDDVKRACKSPATPAFMKFFTARDRVLGTVVDRQGTDSEGVYQLQIPGGEYSLCDDQKGGCVDVTVPANGVVRADEEVIFEESPTVVPVSTCAQ